MKLVGCFRLTSVLVGALAYGLVGCSDSDDTQVPALSLSPPAGDPGAPGASPGQPGDPGPGDPGPGPTTEGLDAGGDAANSDAGVLRNPDPDASADATTGVIDGGVVADAGQSDAPLVLEAGADGGFPFGDGGHVSIDGGTHVLDGGVIGHDASVLLDASSDAPIVILTDGGLPEAAPVDAGAPPKVAFQLAGAIVAGTGCSTIDTTLSATPGKLHGDLGALKIYLPAGGGPLAERRACSLRVPVEVPMGYYVSKLAQRAEYTLDKSAGASASLATQTTLFGVNATAHTVQWAAGAAASVPAGTAQRVDTFGSASSSAQSMCGPRSTGSLLAVNLALSAQRNLSDSVTLQISDFDLREGIEIELSACP